MLTRILTFLMVFGLANMTYVEDAHAIFGKKAKARRAARKAGRAAKKECKRNGGSRKDCRAEKKIVKNTHKAQSGAFGAKKTAKLFGKAAKHQVKLDCRQAGNASKAQCRKLGRAAKKQTMAQSGAFGAKRSARLQAKANKLKTKVNCQLFTNRTKAECRKMGRAASKLTKAKSGAFGAGKTNRLFNKANKLKQRGGGNLHALKGLGFGGLNIKGKPKKAAGCLKAKLKARSMRFASKNARMSYLVSNGCPGPSRPYGGSGSLGPQSNGGRMPKCNRPAPRVACKPGTKLTWENKVFQKPRRCKMNWPVCKPVGGPIDGGPMKPVCPMPRPKPGCKYVTPAGFKQDPKFPVCPKYELVCKQMCKPVPLRPGCTQNKETCQVSCTKPSGPTIPGGTGGVKPNKPTPPPAPALNCQTEVTWFINNCKKSMNGGVHKCKEKAGLLKSKCARDLARLSGAGQSSQSTSSRQCQALNAKVAAICKAQPTGHKCKQYTAAVAKKCKR